MASTICPPLRLAGTPNAQIWCAEQRSALADQNWPWPERPIIVAIGLLMATSKAPQTYAPMEPGSGEIAGILSARAAKEPDPIEFEPASRNYTRRLPKVGGILSAMNGVIPIGQRTSYAYLGGPKREGLRPLRQLPLKISAPST